MLSNTIDLKKVSEKKFIEAKNRYSITVDFYNVRIIVFKGVVDKKITHSFYLSLTEAGLHFLHSYTLTG